jgi:hypothetical protein
MIRSPLPGLLALSLILILTGDSRAVENKAGKISVEKASYDFGFIPIDYKFTHYYKIRNTGSDELHIIKTVPNCDCTMAIPSDTLISPDSVGDIKIVFDTRNYYGKTSRAVTVYSNDPDSPAVKLEFLSNIGIFPKSFQVDPHSLFFLQGHKSKEVRLLNLSDSDVKFSVEMEPDSLFALDKTTGTIKPNKPVILTVSPGEKLPRGTYYSNFTVTYKSEPEARITVPVKIVRF